jgi:hypothetical protein
MSAMETETRTRAMETETRTQNTEAASMMNDRMDPIQISTGRFVAFGHYVENFGQKAVVVGSRETAPGEWFLFVRPLNSAGKMELGGWLANPKFCK